MTSTTRTSVVRLTTPGEIASAVPLLCGYTPSESVVLISLRGLRKRVGLTVRLDLPGPADPLTAVVGLLVDRIVGDGASHALVVVFSERERCPELVAGLSAALCAGDVVVDELLHVQDGRWSSYSCSRSCCPAKGTPLAEAQGPALERMAAESALTGKAVLGSREELVRSLAGPVLLEAASTSQLLADVELTWLARRLEIGAAPARREAIAHARRVLTAVADGGQLDRDDACRLTVAVCGDVLVRDEIATWALRRADELLSLLLQSARLVTDTHCAPLCTLLAWVAYSKGDGGLANVALDRAMRQEPDYTMAGLLRTALDAGIPPGDVRSLLHQTARDLSGRRRGRR